MIPNERSVAELIGTFLLVFGTGAAIITLMISKGQRLQLLLT